MPYSERMNESSDGRKGICLNCPQIAAEARSGATSPPGAGSTSCDVRHHRHDLGGLRSNAGGCGQERRCGANDSRVMAPQKPQLRRVLMLGGMAYVRIKEFEGESRKNASPEGKAQTLRFGDAVKLEAKRDGPPAYWLVSDGKGGSQSWIPGYLLTPSVAEVDMLRSRNRIPETMTYIYEQIIDGKVDARQHGRVHMPGFGFVATITGDEGVEITDQGSSQVAIQSNAVVFDEAVVKQVWAAPMIFSDGNRRFPMAAGKMFYCTDGAGAGKFDVMVLP